MFWTCTFGALPDNLAPKMRDEVTEVVRKVDSSVNADTYRTRVNALALIASGGFAGANMFIGTSMGVYWLSLDPLDYMNGFGPQFQRFLFTIMPLFSLTIVGLVLSLRLDWRRPDLRRNWLVAIGIYVAISLITMGYHMPENLRLIAAEYTAEEAAAARTYWLSGHIPRVVLAFFIPFFVFKAILAYTKRSNDSD